MPDPNTVKIIIFAAFALLILLILSSSNRSKKEALGKLSGYINGRLVKFSLIPTFCGDYEGLRFSLFLLPAGRGQGDCLKVVFLRQSPFKLNVYRQNYLSNLGKKLGLLLKTGDEIFDQEFWVFSDNWDLAKSYLGDNVRKDAIRELFISGYSAVSVKRKEISAQKPNYSLGFDLQPQAIRAVLAQMGVLAKGLS